jgi:hypothetical protein
MPGRGSGHSSIYLGVITERQTPSAAQVRRA